MRGAPVCEAHGGGAAQVKRAARRRLNLAAADKKLRELDYEPIGDPIEELADLSGQVKAMVEWAGARMAELALDDLSYTSDHGLEQLRSQVAIFERFVDRLGRMLNDLAKLGLEERRVLVEAAKVELVAEALRVAAERAGLPAPQRDAVIDAFAVAVVELEKANGEAVKTT